MQSSIFGENYNAPCSAVSLRQLSILFLLERKLDSRLPGHALPKIYSDDLFSHHRVRCVTFVVTIRQ